MHSEEPQRYTRTRRLQRGVSSSLKHMKHQEDIFQQRARAEAVSIRTKQSPILYIDYSIDYTSIFCPTAREPTETCPSVRFLFAFGDHSDQMMSWLNGWYLCTLIEIALPLIQYMLFKSLQVLSYLFTMLYLVTLIPTVKITSCFG